MPKIVKNPIVQIGGAIVGAALVAFGGFWGWLVVTAVTVGVSLLLGMRKQKASPQHQNIKQAMSGRLLVLGRELLGGSICFYETFSSDMYKVLIHCQGPIDAIEGYYLDDKWVGPNLFNGAPSPWGSRIWGETRLGGQSQEPFQLLREKFPQWTAAHRLNGLACTVLLHSDAGDKKNPKVWGGGIPSLRVLARGIREIHDPRSNASSWTENSALHIFYYLTSTYTVTTGGVTKTLANGFGIDWSKIDQPSFIAFANICDQRIALAAGDSEPRYRQSMTINMAESKPSDNLALMLKSCDAMLFATPEGKVGIAGGVWITPTVTISDGDILNYEYMGGSGRASAFNRLKITYKEPRGYQPTECQAWENFDDQAVRGVLVEDYDVQNVTSFTQARRLARIFMMKGNPKHKMTLSLNYGAALQVWGERTVYLSLSELGFREMPFFVGGATLDIVNLTGSVELTSANPEAYDWSTSFEGLASTGDVSQPVALVIPNADVLTVTFSTEQISDTLKIISLIASMPDMGVKFGGYFEYRLDSGEWQKMNNISDYVAQSGIVSDGATYDVRAAYIRPGPYGSDPDFGTWSPVRTIKVLSNATPPASSGSNLSVASVGSGNYKVSWNTPNDANYSISDIYLGNTWASAAVVATSYSPAGIAASITLSAATGNKVWVLALNGSGIAASAPLGSVNIP